MKDFLKNPKFKNPWFWLGLVSIIFGSAGVDMNTLTSWGALGQAVLGILQNPVAVMAVIGGILGVFNDNGSKGLDRPVEKEKIEE